MRPAMSRFPSLSASLGSIGAGVKAKGLVVATAGIDVGKAEGQSLCIAERFANRVWLAVSGAWRQESLVVEDAWLVLPELVENEVEEVGCEVERLCD